MNKNQDQTFHVENSETDAYNDLEPFPNLHDNDEEDRMPDSLPQVLNAQGRFVVDVLGKSSVIDKKPVNYNFMYFVISGVFKITADFVRGNGIITAGHLFVLSCDQTCTITIQEESRMIIFKFTSIIFPYNIPFFQSLADKKKFIPYTFTTLPFNDSLSNFLELVTNGLQSSTAGYHFHLYCHGLLNIILRRSFSSDELLNIFYNIIDKRLEFRSKILLNYPKAHNVNELVDLMGMSKSTFLKIFTEEYGMSPKQWLTDHKKKFILMNLVTPGVTVKDLMFRCGFDTPSNFTRFFQKNFHCTPTYAIEHKDELAPQIYLNVRNMDTGQSETTIHIE